MIAVIVNAINVSPNIINIFTRLANLFSFIVFCVISKNLENYSL